MGSTTFTPATQNPPGYASFLSSHRTEGFVSFSLALFIAYITLAIATPILAPILAPVAIASLDAIAPDVVTPASIEAPLAPTERIASKLAK